MVDPETDGELLGNFCRQHATLVAIRKEKAMQISAGTFQTMTPGRDKALQLNPLLTAEGRLVASLNRMLRALGLALSREEQDRRSKKRQPNPPPPGFPADAVEPPWGWALEEALCGPFPEPSAVELEADRRRKVNEALLAESDWRKYETDFD